MRVIVCGGRYYRDREAVFDALDSLHRKRTVSLVIEGDSVGADRLGRAWAIARAVGVKTYHANFAGIGPSAGPHRNGEMVRALVAARGAGDDVGVVAFPGGRGTADCCAKAEAAGITVWRPYG